MPTGSSTLASPVRVTEDSIYVAVGRDVMRCKSILIWAIQHSEANRICILYVHQPAKWQISKSQSLFSILGCKRTHAKTHPHISVTSLDSKCIILFKMSGLDF